MSKKKGGRPKLPEAEIRNSDDGIRINLFLNGLEFSDLATRMRLLGWNPLNRSDRCNFIRENIIKFTPRETITDKVKRQQLEQIYLELSRIGNNLNQLAKSVNKGDTDQLDLSVLLELKGSIDGLRGEIL